MIKHFCDICLNEVDVWRSDEYLKVDGCDTICTECADDIEKFVRSMKTKKNVWGLNDMQPDVSKCNLINKCEKSETCLYAKSSLEPVYDFTKICLNKGCIMYAEHFEGQWREIPKVDESCVEGKIEESEEGLDGTVN